MEKTIIIEKHELKEILAYMKKLNEYINKENKRDMVLEAYIQIIEQQI